MAFRNPLRTVPGVDTGGSGQRVVISGTGGREGGGAVLLYPNTTAAPGSVEAGTDDNGPLTVLRSPPNAAGISAILTLRGYGPFGTEGANLFTPGDATIDAQTVTLPHRLRLPSTGDVSLTSTGHPLQMGPDGGVNTIYDGNEMAARTWNATTNTYDASSFGMTVSNVGISGSATLGVQGTSTSSAVRKDYVDTTAGTSTSTALALVRRDSAKGIGVGSVSIDNNPTQTNHAVRKDYVDARVNLPDAGWTAAILGNGWTNVGGNYVTARYRMLSSGQVETQGVITGGTFSTTVFMYPVGYRPNKQVPFDILGNNAAGRVDVLATGAFQVVVGSSAASTMFAFTFTADQ